MTNPAPLDLSIARFLGQWSGGGTGHYPSIDDFSYDEEIEFSVPAGKPFAEYVSRTRRPDGGAPMHTERGYLRPDGAGGLEWLIVQPTGYVEIHTGRVDDGGVVELDCHTLSHSPTAKPVTGIRRRLEIGADSLAYDLWMEYGDSPMTHHLRADLRRRD